MSADPNMIKAYQEGKDLYATIAMGVYHNDYWDNMEHHEDGSANPEGKKRRGNCKKLLLGITYGMGAKSIAESIGGTLEEAQEIIDNFYRSFPKVKTWMDESVKNAQKTGYVEDFWGRRRRLPDIQLPPFHVEYKDKNNANMEFNPLLGALGLIGSGKEDLLSKYFKLAEKTKSRKELESLEQQALKDGVILHSNSGKIAQAERQCVNARIQGCLSGDTLISTKEYGIIPIESHCGENVTVWDGKEWSKSIITDSGLKQKCIITFSNKQQIICSPDHKFLTVNARGDERFKKCSELKYNDRIRVSTSFGRGDISYKSSIVNSDIHNANNYSVDMIKDRFVRGQLLGRIASDGHIMNRPDGGCGIEFIVAEHEKDVLDFILSSLPYKFSVEVKEDYKKGVHRNQKLYVVNVYSKSLMKEIVKLDIKHQIDNKILSDTEMLRGFLSGLFDGDSTSSGDHINLSFGTQCDFNKYMRQIQTALLFFGVRSRIYKFKDCHRVSIYKKDCVKFSTNIGFINANKQKLAVSINTVYDEHVFGSDIKIVSVEKFDDLIQMYDVCDTERGYFVANGVVVHNSAASMSKKAMVKVHHDSELKNLGFKMLIAVHDELIGECPAENAELVADRLTTIMKHSAEPEVVVPFKCDPTIEPCWYYSDYADTMREAFEKAKKEQSDIETLFEEFCETYSECTPEQIKEILNDLL